ncbi:2-amino-4-hydroxy-6-hydroxymethyldihydropteridine diphosphokinase [Lacihabitans lacunae]|uniref:2-amino-4-hydroxy-6-hydroxymethyldihydropteridine pyrophosphokinase n=1 Tax=Lacihabitans lacunae TaxID=1028214 RepID=A0ABV7YUX6_9BACT
MFEVYLGIGSNIGDSKMHLQNCIEALNLNIGKVSNVSSVYETEAWGNQNQANFFNQVVQISTDILPFELLKKIKELETHLGRTKTVKWGPRVVDIDILLYSNYHFTAANLQIPHAFLKERRFVLAPLAEINPALIHPILMKKMGILLEECKDTAWIKKIN